VPLQGTVMLTESQRHVLRDFPTLVWYCGPDDPELAWVNDTWLTFTGRTLEQECGYGFLEGVHPDDRDEVVDRYLDHYRRRAPYQVEYRLRRHDGEHRWLYELGRPLMTPTGDFAGFLGACYDVTDRRGAVEQLEASEAMSRLLVQTIFHDLAAPLGAAVAAVDLLRGRVEADPEATRILDLLAEQHTRMNELLVALRHLDQAEHGEEDGRAVPTTLAAVVGDLADGLDLQGRTLHRDLASVPCEVDVVLLCRAVDNLLRNAVEHTPADTTIWVRTELADGRPQVTIEDDGPGLPEDPQALFEPYRRGEETGGSVGLGLSIAHRYLTAIGGRVTAGQRPGGGARFTVELPADLVVEAPADLPAEDR
jgi:PAS domain S-box-containing protein